MSIISTPALIGMAIGKPPQGPHRCFYCGADCEESNSVDDHVKDTFTNWSQVACPGSKWVCHGCVYTMEQSLWLSLPDGTERRVDRNAGRIASWMITPTKLTAFLPANRHQLRDLCANPPTEMFAVSVAVSGQKHLLYRAPVNPAHNPAKGPRNTIRISFEEEHITYRPVEFASLVAMVEPLIAIYGKTVLGDPFLGAQYRPAPVDTVELLSAWHERCREPIARLALHLSPSRDELTAKEFA